jgi:hypothetical protein
MARSRPRSNASRISILMESKMSDEPELLTLAQTRRLARYSPNELSMLSAAYSFPHPFVFPPSSLEWDRGSLMWLRQDVEQWILWRNSQLLDIVL